MQTFAQLTKQVSNEAALELVISFAQKLRFNARSWQSGSLPRTLLEILARVYAAQSAVVTEIAKSGFNDTATGDWLGLLSRSHYNNEPKPGTYTEGRVQLTAAANAPGPFAIAAGDLVFADRIRGRTYRNVEALLLPANTVMTNVLVRAEVMGADGDAPAHTITIMQTPLAGVTVNNPPLADSNSWITLNGADPEQDENLRERNRLKWATRSASTLPGLGFAYYALEAHLSVRRAHANTRNPRGPGTIDVYIAGDSGELSQTVADEVFDYLAGEVDDVPRLPLGSDLLVRSAVNFPVSLRGQVFILTQYNTKQTQQAIVDALKLQFRALPIGGLRTSVGGQGSLPFGDLYRVLLSVPGVRNVVFTYPTGDLLLPEDAVAVPVTQLSYVSV